MSKVAYDKEDQAPPTTQDAFKERIKEVLEDFEAILDWSVDDTDDPDVIDITIRGRLKDDLGQPQTQKDDPALDYDRAMKGLPCETLTKPNLRN